MYQPCVDGVVARSEVGFDCLFWWWIDARGVVDDVVEARAVECTSVAIRWGEPSTGQRSRPRYSEVSWRGKRRRR